MSQTIGILRGWGRKALSGIFCLVCARRNGASWTGQKALRISEVSCGVLAGGGVAHGSRLYLAQTKVTRAEQRLIVMT